MLVPGAQGEATAGSLRASAPDSSVLTPPTTGLGFFTCHGEEARRLDAWWVASGLADTHPVIVAAHDEGLADWLRGVDGDLVVALPGEDARADYTGLPGVLSVVTANPRELAQVALQAFGETGQADTSSGDGWEEATDTPPGNTGWRRAEPGPSRQTTAADDPFAILSQVPSLYAGEGPPAAIEPIVVEPGPPTGAAQDGGADDLAGEPDEETDGAPSEPVARPSWYTDAEYTWEPEPRPAEPGASSHDPPAGNGWSATLSLAELVGLLSDAGDGHSGFPGDGVRLEHPPLCIAVVSPEGGITRTASATAQAVVLGEAVRPLRATVGLVNAAPGDPDVWAPLGATPGMCTVREVILRLTRGEPVREAALAPRLPLAFYPEAEGAFEGYAPTQIQRAATYLRGRHAATVVDLPNRRPGFSSAEAAVAALWIWQSDVVVLPATANPASLRGVLDYLGTESVRDKPVVVAYLVPRGRHRRPGGPIRSLFEEVRRNVGALIDLPDDDTGTEALVHQGTAAGGGELLRHSHLRLVQAAVQAAARQPQGVRT